MEKIKNTINLIKTMLNTSYDTSELIDKSTKKLNKKSTKTWLLIGVVILVLYLSNIIVGNLKSNGAETFFLEIFFLILQILIIFQTIMLGLNVMYFSEDIENYLCLPISNTKFQFTKFAVIMSIMFGTEITIVLPALYVYGINVVTNMAIYMILVILILFLISIFLATLVLILIIPVMKIFKFIKNKYWYQSIVVLIMTVILLMPMTMQILLDKKDIEVDIDINQYEQMDDITNYEEEQLNKIISIISKANNNFVVSNLGVKALKSSNIDSFKNVVYLLILDVIALTVYFLIGKVTYIKDVLWCLSMGGEKKKEKVNLKKKCKMRNKKIVFIQNDITDIMKNPTFFMHYIYNVLIILSIIIILSITIIPTIKQIVIESLDEQELKALSFDFAAFSIILGIIQVFFTVSPISLTAISRYGKHAIFFKYIPIKMSSQFRMKNIPQIIMGIIVMIAILITIHYLFPEIGLKYLLYIFIIGMLLNIIYSYILLLIDLKRPQLNNESEISVIQQNDNKLLKYITTVSICVILWYIYQVTKKVSLDISILIEFIILSIIWGILEIILNKKNDELFEKIY